MISRLSILVCWEWPFFDMQYNVNASILRWIGDFPPLSATIKHLLGRLSILPSSLRGSIHDIQCDDTKFNRPYEWHRDKWGYSQDKVRRS